MLRATRAKARAEKKEGAVQPPPRKKAVLAVPKKAAAKKGTGESFQKRLNQRAQRFNEKTPAGKAEKQKLDKAFGVRKTIRKTVGRNT